MDINIDIKKGTLSIKGSNDALMKETIKMFFMSMERLTASNNLSFWWDDNAHSGH